MEPTARAGHNRVLSRSPARLRFWPLAVATVAVEVLAAAGTIPRWAGLAREVALPPLDLADDISLLLSRAASWPWFGVGLMASLLARSALLAATLGWSRACFVRVLRFYLACLPLCYLSAALVDASQTVLYAALFWAGLAVLVLTTLALGPAVWKQGGLRRSLADSVRHGARLPTLVAYLAALALLAGSIRLGGGAAELASVPASALLTAGVASRLARPGPRPRRPRLVVSVVVVALVLVVLVLPAAPDRARPAGGRRSGSLFLVAGLDTSSGHGTLFELDPRTLGFSCASTYYFSYRGVGHGGPQGQAACPIRTGAPYRRADTERPLPGLIQAFDAEVARLPTPVTVITHSAAGWLAWGAVARPGPSGTSKTPGIDRLVLLAPLVGPLGYPEAGHSGPGVVGAAGARLVATLGRRVHFSTFRLDAPLARQLMGTPKALKSLLARHLPRGVRTLAVPAAYDLPLLAGASVPLPVSELACSDGTTHSGVVTSPATARAIKRFLEGRDPGGCGFWDRWPGLIGAGFRAPPR